MGEAAEMMLDGTCCMVCGEVLEGVLESGESFGFPKACMACAKLMSDPDPEPDYKVMRKVVSSVPLTSRMGKPRYIVFLECLHEMEVTLKKDRPLPKKLKCSECDQVLEDLAYE